MTNLSQFFPGILLAILKQHLGTPGYTAAIISCEKGQQWQHALQLFFAMPKMSLRPMLGFC
jgi:hypothetical protein